MANSLGLIETVGLPAAIAAADAAVKSANIQLLDYELTRGQGLVTVKFEGDVGAVKAALDAAEAAAHIVGEVYSKLVIARPNEQLEKITKKEKAIEAAAETAGDMNEIEQNADPEEDHSETSQEEAANDGPAEEVFSPEANEEKGVCNLCHDPECPRRKGDLRSLCIHYEN